MQRGSPHIPSRRERIAQLLLFLGSLGLTALCGVLGINSAVDVSLRRLYYDLRGERSTSVSVVLVALDEGTVKEWGAPPWSWEQFERLSSAIMQGKPRLVALLEPTPRVLPDGEPIPGSALMQARDQGLVLLPASTVSFAQQALRVGTRPIDTLYLQDVDGVRPVVARALEKTGLPLPRNGVLHINFIGPPASLPTVAAHRVASGEIPASTFADRIVVIGLQGERFAPMVPTPVGPMSPAQVQAHALAGTVDDASWHTLLPWLNWLITAILVMLTLYLMPRLPNRIVLILATAVLAVFVAADYWLFAAGIALVGVAQYMAAIGAAMMGAWLLERARIRRDVVEFTRWMARQGSQDLRADALRKNEASFLDSFLRASRTYIDFHSTIFAELPPGSHHLEFQVCVGTQADDVFEKRRDIRREPYSLAYQSHRPEWSNRCFMKEELGLKTLMVPLVELGRILGYWIINFPREVEVSNKTFQTIEMLASEASSALEQRRSLAHTAPMSEGSLLRGPSMVLAELRDARQTAVLMLQTHSRIDELFELLPVGVLVATVWGEIEQVNAGMRKLLGELGVDEPSLLPLPALLAKITGVSEAEVQEELRRLLDQQSALRLRVNSGDAGGREPSHDFVLARVRGSLGRDDGSTEAAHFILTASERSQRSGVREPWLRDTDAARPVPLEGGRAIEDSGAVRMSGHGRRSGAPAGNEGTSENNHGGDGAVVDLNISKRTGSNAN